MVLLLATLLSAAPVTKEAPTARTASLRTSIDFGGLIISYWYVPETRAHIEAALVNARGSLIGNEVLNGGGLLMALPVLGPLMTAAETESMQVDARALLCVTGLLQLAGLSLGAVKLFDSSARERPKGPVLSISPISSGRLGLSLRLTGY